MKKILTLILVACWACVTQAQVLTLDSCLELARQHNCTIRSAQLEVAMAQEVKKQMLWKYFPQVSINAFGFGAAKNLISIDLKEMDMDFLSEAFDLLQGLVGDQYDRTISSEINLMHWGVSATAMAVQPVYWGGQIVSANQLAKLGIDASRLKAEVSERDLLQEVEESYWLVVGLIEKRTTIAEVKNLLDTALNVANAAYVSGLVTSNDLLRVQLKKNEVDTKSLQLENGIHLASRALCQLIGIPYEKELELEPFADNEELETLVLLDTFSVSGRQEVQLLEMNIKAQKLLRRITIGETLPHLAIGVQGGYTNFFDKNRGNGLVFATLSIPLTQWGETAHKIKEHNMRIEQAEMMRDDLVGKMSLQNEQAYDQLTESIQLMMEHQSSEQLAKDNYRITLMNYQAGIQTMTDLLESQTLLLMAENAYTDARISYRAALRRYNDLNK